MRTRTRGRRWLQFGSAWGKCAAPTRRPTISSASRALPTTYCACSRQRRLPSLPCPLRGRLRCLARTRPQAYYPQASSQAMQQLCVSWADVLVEEDTAKESLSLRQGCTGQVKTALLVETTLIAVYNFQGSLIYKVK